MLEIGNYSYMVRSFAFLLNEFFLIIFSKVISQPPAFFDFSQFKLFNKLLFTFLNFSLLKEQFLNDYHRGAKSIRMVSLLSTRLECLLKRVH